MSQIDKVQKFVDDLYSGQDKTLSKDKILHEAKTATFAADVQIFFKQIDPGDYNKSKLKSAINQKIKTRGRTEAIGGMLK